jgi:hypothetical protein
MPAATDHLRECTMAAKSRTASPPSPGARDHVLQVIRAAAEPLTARAVARLLAPPHRVKAAVLGPLLDAEAAAGRLFRLLPPSERGAPRYWDRDPSALLYTAALAAVQRSDGPRTARELLGDLGLSFKTKEPELTQVLIEQVASGAVYAIPPKTAKGKPRVWHRDLLDFGRLEILKTLEAKGPQTAAGLKKAIRALTDDQFQQIVQSALDARVLWRHPPLGMSKHELLGKTPPSPDPYLRDVGSQLAKIISRLEAAGAPREALRRSVVQLLEAAGIEFAANPTANGGQSSRAAQPVDLIGLMRRLEPGADRGALVGARDLRRAARLDKRLFDEAVLELARQGRLSLHQHDFAASLSPAERDDLVTDGAGTYYVGIALRSGSAAPSGSATM